MRKVGMSVELLKTGIKQYTETASFSITNEEILESIVPDIYPDITAIVTYNASVRVKEKYVQENAVTVTGEIPIRVFFNDENGKMFALDGLMPFNHVKTVAGVKETDVLIIETRIEKVTADAINPRKIGVRAMLSIDARVYASREIEYYSDVVREEGDKLSMLKEHHESYAIVGIVEKRVALTEEIRLSGDISPQDNILHASISWKSDDVKILANKVMLRGTAKLDVVTLSANGAFSAKKVYSLPFSQIMDIEGVENTDEIEIEYKTMRLETSISERQDGINFLVCDASCEAAAFVHRAMAVTVLSDAFSTAYDAKYETENVWVPYRSRKETCEVRCSENIGGMDAAKVFDAKITPYNIGIDKDGNHACCKCCCQILYENASGCIRTITRTIDAKAAVNCASACEKIYVDIEDESAIIDGAGGINITLKVVFQVFFRNECQCRQIRSFAVDRQKPKAKVRGSSLILRRIESRESVWSVAKAFNTTPEAILSANNLTNEDQLIPGKLILIPFVG